MSEQKTSREVGQQEDATTATGASAGAGESHACRGTRSGQTDQGRVPSDSWACTAERRATSGDELSRPDSLSDTRGASVRCEVDAKPKPKLAEYDWDALSSAATSLPAPARLAAALDRDDCLARHAHLERRERDLDNAKQVRTAKAIIGPGKRSAAAPLLHLLDPLNDGFLSSVSLNQPARGSSFCTLEDRLKVPAERTTLGAGKLLPVRIVSQPLRTVSVQFVVEDARGNPVPVQLFHVPTTLISQEQLQDWFPIGAVFGTIHDSRRFLPSFPKTHS